MKKTKLVNFDIIRKQAAREKIPHETLKKYQTVTEDRIYEYPKKDQIIFLSHAFREQRPDIHFERNVIRNHFKCK